MVQERICSTEGCEKVHKRAGLMCEKCFYRHREGDKKYPTTCMMCPEVLKRYEGLYRNNQMFFCSKECGTAHYALHGMGGRAHYDVIDPPEGIDTLPRKESVLHVVKLQALPVEKFARAIEQVLSGERIVVWP